MAVASSLFSPVQSPFHIFPEEEVELPDRDDNISNFDIDADVNCTNEDGLSASKSVESLTTLLNCLPDIVIPDTLYNPLPLQCLAASALPEAVSREIEQVIRECTESMASPAATSPRGSQADLDSSFGDASAVLEQVDVTGGLEGKQTFAEGTDNGNLVVSSSKETEAIKVSGSGENDETISLHKIIIKRDPTRADININDLGFGFEASGGVRCSSCKTLHMVVTSVSADLAISELQEGMSIQQWGGKRMEDLSFEQARARLKGLLESGQGSFEIVLKKCSGVLIGKTRQFGQARFSQPGVPFRFWQRQVRPSSRPVKETATSQAKGYDTDSSSGSGDPHSDKSRPASLELLDSPAPAYAAARSLNSTPSPPTSPALSRRDHPDGVEVSIPRLDSNARALEVRPRSPLTKGEGAFSRFPNGMIQVSLKYSPELEDLQITLHEVKGQSNRGIHDPSDVFVNTHLIPDNRDQGVRSIPVSEQLLGNGKGGGEDSHSYMVTPDELDECVLRIVLWDARKSKKPFFRGEVLLCLCDASIIPLNNQPMWFTVCPLDPNLPALPAPVHYKHHKNHMEHLFSKLKLKAWNLANISSGTVKPSSSVSGRLQDMGVATVRSSKGNKKSKGPYSREFLEMLESKLEESSEASLTRHTINEAKLRKLRSIVDVLRDTAGGDTDDTSDTDLARPTHSKRDTVPEFVKVFDPDAVDTTNSRAVRKRKKKLRLSKKAGLRALLEDSPDISSDSGDNLDDDGPPSASLNKTSMAWIQSRKMEANSRPLSDSFNTIGRLRESLNAGKMNRVSNYTFDDQSPEKPRPQSALAGMEGYGSTVTTKLDTTSKNQSHVTSKGRESCESPKDSQVHYKVIDSRDSPVQGDQKFSSPVCKYYSVPVEVSLHRISIVDVDKQPEIEIARTRSFGMQGAKPPTHNNDTDSEVMRIQVRSRSLGELDHFESDDEVLLVRAPVASHQASVASTALTSSLDSPRLTRKRVASESGPSGSSRASQATRTQSMTVGGGVGVGDRDRVDGGEEASSLDFTAIRKQVDIMTAAASGTTTATEDYQSTHTGTRKDNFLRSPAMSQRDSFLSPEEPQEELVRSWQPGGGRGEEEGDSRRNTLSKARSLDNLMAGTLPRTKKSRNSWKNLFSHNKTAPSDTTEELNVGDAKLELEFNDINPNRPVLMVKLLDAIFQTRNSTSDFLMKCLVVHKSSGVVILKNKAVINTSTKTFSPTGPMGLLQFQTDIFNLALEITFFSLGMFSKREIGHIMLDLSTVDLDRDTNYCKWLPIKSSHSTA